MAERVRESSRPAPEPHPSRAKDRVESSHLNKKMTASRGPAARQKMTHRAIGNR